ETTALEAKGLVGLRQAVHAVAVDRPAIAADEFSLSAVAVVSISHGQPLEDVPERGLLNAGRRHVPMPVVGRPAHTGERTQTRDRQVALRRRHRLDHGEDGLAPGPSLDDADALMCRKARAKKSNSSACCPPCRSSSPTRCTSAGPAAPCGVS